MSNRYHRSSSSSSVFRSRGALVALAITAALSLSACGGGEDDLAATVPSTASSDADVDVSVDASADGVEAHPSFHLAPAILDEPVMVAETDVPHTEDVSEDLMALPTEQLLPSAIYKQVALSRAVGAQRDPNAARLVGVTAPLVVFTPAQIRAAYKLPPANSYVPTNAAARAALGAGQTIYIVNAFHHPNALSDLAAYNRTFGLPVCTTVPILSTTALPLAPVNPTGGCTVSVVYSTTTGARTPTAPAYNQGWATEIAMDLQTAHAIAPLARLVLIEAPSAAVSVLSKAVNLANSMGPGIVSMSFGAPEGSWGSTYDASFKKTGMRYVAATGDSGMAVNWPSSSAFVVGTGGTTLTYNGVTRSEVVWSKTGGGISKYVLAPTYQANLPVKNSYRRVADVAFNSDPYTGQYIAFTPSGGAQTWLSGGGTSIAAPAWAGLLASGEAVRKNAGLAPLVSIHDALYKSILPVASVYSQAFLDVKTGAHGTCTTCLGTVGYDSPTGVGSPNATALWSTMTTLAK